VYSNLPQVTLLANGKEIETKQGDKVFEFTVPLDGEVLLEAKAGEYTDSASIRRVAKPNPAYKLRRGEGNGGNWT
ncbi:MAG: glycoside hydrolase family 2 protein, partial [Oscillospiraceae bacterium]|nr:glycoside hydrolase family 2 protein [Oscillospiraceae bacterium]